MGAITPLFVGVKKAAKMLDLTSSEFLALVEAGALPRPERIGGKFERWSVKSLEAISTGEVMDDNFQW